MSLMKTINAMTLYLNEANGAKKHFGDTKFMSQLSNQYLTPDSILLSNHLVKANINHDSGTVQARLSLNQGFNDQFWRI